MALNIQELQNQRSNVAKAMRTLVDNTDTKTGMTEEQSGQWEKMNAEINNLDKSIKRAEQLAEIENRLDNFDPVPRDQPAGKKLAAHATEEYTQAFEQVIRSQNAPQDVRAMVQKVSAALSVGTNTEGGFIVPESWATQLIKDLADENIMRQLGTVVSTASTTNLPIVDDKGAAGWLAENAAYPESDIVFANMQLLAHKLGRIMKVSEELLEDETYNLLGEISLVFAETFGTAEETAMFTGDGTGKPTGILTTADLGLTAALNTAITLDELMDLQYSVKEKFRRNGTWTMRDSTAKLIRKLKSSDGIPLWQPSLTAGQPDSFSGYALRTTDGMPAVAASASPIAFGDFSYYRIADRGGIFMQRLNETYAAEGGVGFRMRKRVDAKLTRTAAVKRLALPA